ncbi:sigma factor-like helix-turn-helix DNA-binding protein [Streptomyces xinghaiensis]|uniref:sigma factor-like helix-turn-helix DNA-binding protein n=1 Tax=Streptomyces xinghaiensis TaxID=1038928 RepID=UPI002E0ED8B4|nr:RNA polymerase [Streptomyces xinghaiensis]
MRERWLEQDRRRDRDFDAFVAGAAGRLLHTATLLTGDRAAAERLLTAALARTYAGWDRLRGDDPYDLARQELAARYANTAWRRRRPHGGVLDGLTAQERLIVVLRLHEGVPEEQTAAQLGLPADRVRAICLRSVSLLRSSSRTARRGGPERTERAADEPVDGGAPGRAALRTGTGDATGDAGAGRRTGGPGGRSARPRPSGSGDGRESGGSPP